MTHRLQVGKKHKRLFERSRYKALYSGRGAGKSHDVAGALVTRAYNEPLRILCAREIQKSIKDSVKRLIDDKIDAAGLGDKGSRFFDSTDTEINGANGSLFIFAGLRTNVTSVKSLEGADIAWVEEANTVSQNSLDTLIPTIRKDRSELWFTWNPKLPTDPVDKMFRSGEPPPDAIIIQTHWQDNPWFPEVLRKDMLWDKKRDLDKYLHIWEGEYLRNSESRVFKNWRVGSEEEFKPTAETRFYYGADWGFSVDPTALVRCYINGRTLYFDYEAWAIGCEIDKTPALFDAVPDARKWPIRADSARPETISYMQRNGFPRMLAAKKGKDSVHDGVEFLKSFDIVIHPRCRHLQDEFTMYSYKTDPLSGQVLPVLDDSPAKHVNLLDAARYALEDARRPTWRIV